MIPDYDGDRAIDATSAERMSLQARSHIYGAAPKRLAAYRFELLDQIRHAERTKDRRALIREAKLARCWQRELRTAMLFASAARDVRVAL